MDAHIELDQLIAELSGPPARSASTEGTYGRVLDYQWKPYAATHHLSTSFSELAARALSTTDLEGVLLAAQTGELRHGRSAAQKASRGTPLSPVTVDSLWSALRRAHAKAGLKWVGDSSRIRELRTAYALRNSKPAARAVPMEVEHVKAMFTAAPQSVSVAFAEARFRAVALSLGFPLASVKTITPEAVTWSRNQALVNLGHSRRIIGCLHAHLADAIAEAACAHCLLGTWLNTAEPGERLIEQRRVPGIRAGCLALARRLPSLQFAQDTLAVNDDDLWTTVAAGLAPQAARWLRARAVLLPMRVAGLQVRDFERLEVQHVEFTGTSVTLTVVDKKPHAQSARFTLDQNVGALCARTALHSYDSWVRAHLPERSRFIVPTRGKTLCYPRGTGDAEPTENRALDQQIRIFLKDQAIKIDNPAPGERRSLTPQSARRGFAVQAHRDGHELTHLQEALRHVRPDTTIALIGQIDMPNTAPSQVLDNIAKDAK